jgi:hypothetical protein
MIFAYVSRTRVWTPACTYGMTDALTQPSLCMGPHKQNRQTPNSMVRAKPIDHFWLVSYYLLNWFACIFLPTFYVRELWCMELSVRQPYVAGLGLGLAASPCSCLALDSLSSKGVDWVVYGRDTGGWFCFHKPPLSLPIYIHVSCNPIINLLLYTAYLLSLSTSIKT